MGMSIVGELYLSYKEKHESQISGTSDNIAGFPTLDNFVYSEVSSSAEGILARVANLIALEYSLLRLVGKSSFFLFSWRVEKSMSASCA